MLDLLLGEVISITYPLRLKVDHWDLEARNLETLNTYNICQRG